VLKELVNFELELYLVMSLKILLATFVGGLIGYMRERHRKPAGIKTHSFVCLGSCLVMIVGLLTAQHNGGEPTRLAAQVVSGVGFLGAGTILSSHGKITGLTSAAGLWFTACLGLVIGSDYTLLVVPALVCYLIIIFFFVKFDYHEEEHDSKH